MLILSKYTQAHSSQNIKLVQRIVGRQSVNVVVGVVRAVTVDEMRVLM